MPDNYIQKSVQEFDYKFKHTDRNEVGYVPVYRTEAIKDFLTQKLQSLALEIIKDIEALSWDDMNCNCDMCYAHKKAINQMIQSIRERTGYEKNNLLAIRSSSNN